MVACPLGQAAINTAARGRVGVKSERDGMEKGCGNVKRKGFVFCTTCWSGSHTHIVIYTCRIHTYIYIYTEFYGTNTSTGQVVMASLVLQFQVE